MAPGLNSNTGVVGIKSAFRIHEIALIDAFAGIGTWGGKYGAGFVFNAKNKNSICPAINIVHATGVNNVPFDGNEAKTPDVKVDCKPATMLNLAIQRHWVFQEKNRLVLELGYSILLKGAQYEITPPSPIFEPTKTDKFVLNLLKPVGFSLGLAFYFGL